MRLQALLEGGVNDEALLRRLAADDSGEKVEESNVKLSFARRLGRVMVVEGIGREEISTGEMMVGLTELGNVKKALQIVVAWWLLPLLLPGVGLPLTKRGVDSVDDETRGGGGGGGGSASRDFIDRDLTVSQYQSLWTVLALLLKLFAMPFVGSLIREAHVPDILAGYLQIAHAPGSVVPAELRQKSGRILRSLLDKQLEVDLALESMLCFVGPSSPEWLRIAAGQRLSRTMLRPNAVMALLTNLLHDKPEAQSNSEGLLDKTAVLVTTVPKSHRNDMEGFRIQLLGQLRTCLRSKSDVVRLCVAICIERLLREDSDVVVEHFLIPLLKFPPLNDEQAVDNLVTDLTLLMVPCGAGGSGLLFWECVSRQAGRMLLLLGCCVCGTASRLSTPVARILESLIRAPSQDSVRRLALHHMILDTSIPSCNSQSFALGPSGGAVATEANVSRDWERECSVLSSYALKNAPSELLGDLFSEAMLVVASAEQSSTRYFVMLELASELLGIPSLLQDAMQILLLAKSILSLSVLDEHVVGMILSILDEVVPKLKLEKHQEPLVVELVPLLQNVGHAMPTFFSQCARLVDLISNPRSERLIAKMTLPEPAAEEAFEKAVAELSDPLLPVRANALIQLRKLVLAKDATTLSRFSRVVDIFSKQLRSSDSAIYLGAIRGFSALGDVAPNETIPIMVADFHRKDLSVDVRLKVGEASVNIAQRCGQMLPVFAPVLMDCFLRGIKDNEADVRASSLSNIAAMSEILNWALHPYIREIIFAVDRVLETDKDHVVRRAAALVFGLLVRGPGERLIELAGDQLKDMRQRLSICAESDSDLVVRGHASTTLQEMDHLFI